MQNFRTLGLIIKKGHHLLIYLKNACKKIIFPAKFKKKNYFLKPILLPPYLGPYIYRWFHAKFQDSRTNNKKRTPPSDPKRPLAIFTTVCCHSTNNEYYHLTTKEFY